MPLTSPSKSTNRSPDSSKVATILVLPSDLQVNILTYLRSYDLSSVQKTCKFYANPVLIDSVVTHFAGIIYPSKWTLGFESTEPVSAQKGRNSPSKKVAAASQQEQQQQRPHYTFQHLRNMELLVVARALNSPEPTCGFFVSKSWIKTALRWLEAQQEQQAHQTKKLSKKKQRLRHRKLSDVSPPWPNANSDILCEHQNLQLCSSGRSARARRRVMDKMAWRVLKKIYPDSTQLESALGECLQCTLEAETAKKTEMDRLEKEKQTRQLPLSNQVIFRFFKRRTGVPSQSINPMASLGQCPLVHGTYYCVPRSWCYAWRRYVKTGEGGSCPPPPDAASLLCDAHRLALLPPHLEAYLYGDSPDLLVPFGESLLVCGEVSELFGEAFAAPEVVPPAAAAAAAAIPRVPVPGQGPDEETLQALRAAGIPVNELGQQLAMMREIEDFRAPPAVPPVAVPVTLGSVSRNEQLDWENYAVVEILTEDEYLALESLWTWTSARGFGLCFSVDEKGVTFHTTQTCRDCDATGRHHDLHIKNRNRRAIRKSVDKGRAPASLEY